MTSGAYHYRESERLTAKAQQLPEDAHAQRRDLLAEAQVHATLAETAATMAGHLSLTFTATEAWREALGEPEREAIQGNPEPEADREAGE
jgi:hypothetical protein